MPDQSPNEHSVRIEREKTKRTYAYLAVGGLIAALVIVLFFQNVGEGTLRVTKDGIEVTVDQPLSTQLNVSSQNVEIDGDSVEMTTGTISDTIIEVIEKAYEDGVVLPSDRFVGKNLIDRIGGYVLSTEEPDRWKVSHDQVGYTQYDDAIVSLQAPSGTRITVNRAVRDSMTCRDLDCYVRALLDAERKTGGLSSRPSVTTDSATETALIRFRTAADQETIIKVSRQESHWYQARAVISATASPEERKQAINTVTLFSPISKISSGTRFPR